MSNPSGSKCHPKPLQSRRLPDADPLLCGATPDAATSQEVPCCCGNGCATTTPRATASSWIPVTLHGCFLCMKTGRSRPWVDDPRSTLSAQVGPTEELHGRGSTPDRTLMYRPPCDQAFGSVHRAPAEGGGALLRRLGLLALRRGARHLPRPGRAMPRAEGHRETCPAPMALPHAVCGRLRASSKISSAWRANPIGYMFEITCQSSSRLASPNGPKWHTSFSFAQRLGDLPPTR